MIEYTLLISLVTVALVGLVLAMSGNIETVWVSLCEALRTGGPPPWAEGDPPPHRC